MEAIDSIGRFMDVSRTRTGPHPHLRAPWARNYPAIARGSAYFAKHIVMSQVSQTDRCEPARLSTDRVRATGI